MRGAVLAVIAFLAFEAFPGERRSCPEGMVWGGHDCVWKELCRDGTPYVNGKCVGSNKPPQVVTPIQTPPPPVSVQTQIPPSTKLPCVPAANRLCRDAASAYCTGETIFLYTPSGRKTQSARRLLLAGGKAGDLIEEYFSDTARESKGVDPEKLTVFYFDGKSVTPKIVRGDVDVKMGILDFLTRKSMEGVWADYLASITVPPLHCGVELAQCLNADFICNRHP